MMIVDLSACDLLGITNSDLATSTDKWNIKTFLDMSHRQS